MGSRRYVVLRAVEDREILSRGEPGPRRPGEVGPTVYRGNDLERAGGTRETLEADVVTVDSDRQLDEAVKDLDVRLLAEEMPMRMIEPASVKQTSDYEQPDGLNPTWGLEAIGATYSNFKGDGVKVAVLDSGIEEQHPAFAHLAGRLKYWDENDISGTDPNGHGTHVAGTIFGGPVQGQRIGIAPNIETALIAKVFPGDSETTDSVTVAKAMDWASKEGADVLCMSLSIDFEAYVQSEVDRGRNATVATNLALQEYRRTLHLFERQIASMKALGAFEGGTLVIAAAGNQSERSPIETENFVISANLPSSAEGVLSVAAARPNGNQGEVAVSKFSNHHVDISAPGEPITSAWPGDGLREESGTSMAAPHVAGAACLWAQKNRQDTGRLHIPFLEASLLIAADRSRFTDGSTADDYGVGLVQAPT